MRRFFTSSSPWLGRRVLPRGLATRATNGSPRAARLGSVAALSAALLSAGCESQPLSPWENVRLEVFVSQTELVLPQDTLLVRLVATNTSRWPLALDGCSSFFRIRNDAEEAVPLIGFGCLLGVRTVISLPPGKPVEIVRASSLEIASASTPRGRAPLPPGEYQLEGFLGIADFRLVSAPVTIHVRAAQ